MADNYCACNGGDDAEYIIELNQQGPPGVQGEQGEQGYSPVVSYTVNNDTIQFTLVNQDTTSTTPNFYEYVAKKSVVDNHGVLIQNNTNAIDNLELNKLDKDGSNASSDITINNLPIRKNSTGANLGNKGSLTHLYIQAGEVRLQNYSSNTLLSSISLTTGAININAHNKAYYNGNELATIGDIPTKTSDLTNDSGFITSSDLPTVGNGTITLTQGGVTKGTFTTNQSGNTTINLDAGGGAITNPLIIDDTDSTYSLRMGITTINQTRQPFMGFYTSSASGVSIELINSATAPIKLNDLWAGLKTIALNYDNNTLKVNQNGQLYADISAPTYTAGTGIDITNEEISVDSDYIEAHKAYLADGDLLTDEDGLKNVKYYNYSTFDISKFTKVGSPTITADGIASGFSASNNISATFSTITPQNSIILKGKGIYSSTPNSANGNQTIGRLMGTNSSPSVEYNPGLSKITANRFHTNSGQLTSAQIEVQLNDGDVLEYEVIATSTSVTLNVIVNGTSYTNTWSGNGLYFGTINRFQATYPGNYYWTGSIDLKQFSITVDGAEVFSGNKTGTDTYEINNTTITIPYKVSKTGSKIVKSKYRNEVTSVYNNQGYAPYYTLDEANGNFTLPMGEIYGYITRLEGIVKDLQTRLTALESNIDAGGAGVVRQSLLGMSPLSLGRPQLLGELNPEDEMNTMDIEPIKDDIQEEELEPQETEEKTEEGGQDE